MTAKGSYYFPDGSFKLIKARLGDLVDYSDNPVKISIKAERLLADQLKEGQDIPYVISAPPNGRSKKLPLLDGHQRKHADLNINKASPDKMVPVLHPRRKMTDAEVKEWIVRHRKNTGEFDKSILADRYDRDNLLSWGFEDRELIERGGDTEILFDQAVQLVPAREYVVIMCNDAEEWDRLRALLELGEVRRGGYRKGSPFDATGVQRVINASLFLEWFDVDSDTE